MISYVVSIILKCTANMYAKKVLKCTHSREAGFRITKCLVREGSSASMYVGVVFLNGRIRAHTGKGGASCSTLCINFFLILLMY